MPEEQIKTYSLKEIAEHSSEDSLWLLIDNRVYDVTKFKDEHPGGPEILLEFAGKEATEAFEDIGHSSDAKMQLKQYEIGELSESERKENKAERKDYKIPPKSSCFRMRYFLPLGLALTAVVLYKVYSRMNK